MRHGDVHCCGGDIARSVHTFHIDGVHPSSPDASRLCSQQNYQRLVGEQLPVWLSIAVPRAVDRLIAVDPKNLGNRFRVAVIFRINLFRRRLAVAGTATFSANSLIHHNPDILL